MIVNAKTASASEIVSGALQDHDRATIVGEPSFGKGLVQSVYPLSENTGLALTTALYYIPSGRSIQKTFSSQRAFGADDFALGATAAHPNERTDFKTDSGRPVPGGGGIVPDIEVVSRWADAVSRACSKQSASFTSFATEYIRDHKITAGWEVPRRGAGSVSGVAFGAQHSARAARMDRESRLHRVAPEDGDLQSRAGRGKGR